MDAGLFWVYLWFAAVVFFWSLAFYRLKQQVGGAVLFFKNFATAVVILTLISTAIMYSVKDCVGMMCGLLELLITIAIDAATLVIWPLILALVVAPKRAEKMSLKNETWDDVLDH